MFQITQVQAQQDLETFRLRHVESVSDNVRRSYLGDARMPRIATMYRLSICSNDVSIVISIDSCANT